MDIFFSEHRFLYATQIGTKKAIKECFLVRGIIHIKVFASDLSRCHRGLQAESSVNLNRFNIRVERKIS